MTRRLFAIGLAVALSVTLGSCREATSPASSLAAARSQWASRRPAAYTITIQRSCECTPDMSGPVVVSVRDGVVESRLYVSSGAAVQPNFIELFPAVEGLFALVDAALHDGTSPLEVRYHEALGYPTRIELGDPAVDSPVYVVLDFRAR